jgi:hypothetical protein
MNKQILNLVGVATTGITHMIKMTDYFQVHIKASSVMHLNSALIERMNSYSETLFLSMERTEIIS